MEEGWTPKLIEDEDDVLKEKMLNELKPLIGEMVISFNSLEDNVFEFLSEIINDDLDHKTHTNIITEGMNFSAKVNLLNRFVKHYLVMCDKKDSLDDWKELVERIKASNDKRNKLIHAVYDELDPRAKKVKVKTKLGKNGFDIITTNISKEKVEEDIAFVDEIDNDLWQFYCDGDLWES